jgi:hypothetical protein
VLAKNLQSFCEEIGEAFDGVSTVVKSYQLDSVEITVQVSATGEVRAAWALDMPPPTAETILVLRSSE